MADTTIREVSGEKQYIPLSDAALRELAENIVNNLVFGSWMLRDHEKQHMSMVFMPLIFCDDIVRKEVMRDEIVHLWEFYDKAMPSSINGLPIFASMHLLDGNDAERLHAKVKQFKAAMDSVQ